MIRIGIVGAENSHTAAIAKVLNVDRRVPGARVTHVWGETAAYARAAAESGRIPAIVREPEEMAAGFVFLASDEASYVTGIVLRIDGGLGM